MSMENSDTPLLEVKNRCVDYITDDGDFNAVKSVSFSIGQGEIFGLAGESSCCKSTIAFAINRLHKPPAFMSGGKILFKGQDLLSLSDNRLNTLRWSEIAMVFQSAMNSGIPCINHRRTICRCTTSSQRADRRMGINSVDLDQSTTPLH